MPWKASSVMQEKLRFICEYDLGEESMTELCHRYGIARETGYVWLRRYHAGGLDGLQEYSRAAHRQHNRRIAEARGFAGSAQKAFAHGALQRTPGACPGVQPRVVRGL